MRGNSSDFDFNVEDGTGVYRFTKQNSNDLDPQALPSFEYYIKAPFVVGTTWTTIGETAFLQQKVKVNLTHTIDSVSADVSVAAGTYSKCLRVKSTAKATHPLGDPFGSAQVSVERYSWYAPGVGLVKQIINESSNNLMLGQAKAVIELSVFTK